MPELVAKRQRPECPYSVDKEGVRPVERIDKSLAVLGPRPAPGLNGPRGSQGESIKFVLPCAVINPPLIHQAQKVSVGADIVESVVMNSGVREMSGHPFKGHPAPQVQEFPVARGIELKQRGAELKSLRPLGPSPEVYWPPVVKTGEPWARSAPRSIE